MILLSVLLACGTVSNDIFTDDAEFLAALPSAERQAIRYADEVTEPAARGLGEVASLVAASVEASSGVNAFIEQVISAVDEVRATKPAERSADGRRWGPFPWQCDVDISAQMSRSAGVFDWSFTGHRAGSDEEPILLYGTHYAGASVAEGDGQFVWNQAVVGEWCGEPQTGLITVDYDNREGADLIVSIEDLSLNGGEPESWTYSWTRTDTLGDFQYRSQIDPDWDSGEELSDVEARVRWVPGEGGRADAEVTGGSLGNTVLVVSQCFDAGGLLTWQRDNLGQVEEIGDPESCRYDDVGAVDRI